MSILTRLAGVIEPMRLPIHQATADDEAFMMAIAKEKYPDRPIERGAPWVRWCMQNPERLVLVGAHSFGIAQTYWKYGYERRARLDMLCARPVSGSVMEALRMVRLMVMWAKEKGAIGTFILDADTGIDFAPFAERLGGTAVAVTRHEIPL